jgi:uncharacterized membrane protein (UPF0127 family)
MVKEARAKSSDPVQQALRDRKKAWSAESKVFMAKLKALRNGLNGRGDQKFSLEPGKIQDPVPSSVSSFLSSLTDSFKTLADSALKIIQEQKNYSANRKKPKKKEASAFNRTSNILIGDHKLRTFLAVSDKEKEIGLMHQKWPPPVMTFLYTEGEFKKFWMKNTPSPLDIVFCYNGKVASIHEGVPFSTRMVGPNHLSDLVVELPYGTCKKLGIDIGDSVRLLEESED